MNENLTTIKLFDDDYEVADKYEGLITIKELKNYLPVMEEDVYIQLKGDIRANGIIDPILYMKLPDETKLVLEGHTRMQAACELEIKEDSIPTKKVEEEFSSINAIKFWMLQHQIKRRNLSDAQKLWFAMSYKEIFEARAKENLSKAGRKIKIIKRIHTADEIAKLTGVSRETTKRYMKVFEKGTPELLNEVHEGTRTIFNAYNKAGTLKERTQSTDHQYNIVDDYETGIEMLREGSIISLVTIKDEETIKKFMPYQQKNFGFLILKD